MIEQVTQITREVEDQDEALSFYTETLGFEKRADEYMGPVRFVTVAPDAEDDIEIVLQSPDQFEGEEAERRAAMIGQSPELGFAVDDCQATYEELQERGVEFIFEPEERPWGLEAVANDLYGNPLVLYEYTSEAP
jgi:predicted enzyme related to lactoylglutathione lyase